MHQTGFLLYLLHRYEFLILDHFSCVSTLSFVDVVLKSNLGMLETEILILLLADAIESLLLVQEVEYSGGGLPIH